MSKGLTERRKNRTVLYLVLAGIGVAFSVCAAGWLHYSAARHLSASREWLQNAQTAASNLQIESQRIDRIQPAVELYLLTHDQDKFRSAETNSVALYSNAIYLQQLLRDSPGQLARARQLADQASVLVKTVNALNANASLPDLQLLACRETITLMQETEREQLQQRTDEIKYEALRSQLLGISFTAFSLVVVIVLFGFLLRDAHHRQRHQKQLSVANDKLAATIRALERQARESQLLTASRDELQLCVNMQQAEQSTARSLQQLLPGTLGSVCLINSSRQLVEVVATWNDSSALLDGFAVDACCGLRAGRVRWRKPGQSEVHCAHFASVRPEHYVCLPLAAHGETLGVVYIECPSNGIAAMVDAQMGPLHEMIEMAAMSIAGLNLRNRLENQSIRDGLTNLFNRHFMEIALERELHRADRQSTPIAVLMVDVDHFKKINDTFGHEAGDTVLRQVAESILCAVRSEDIVCRYGGEEFVTILPEMSLEGAAEKAEQLRRQISSLNFGLIGPEEITVSIGVAAYPLHADTAEMLMRAADRALYEAKHRGRNCVVVAEQHSHVLIGYS